MTPEQKELLLKDLCTRLPYGVKCQFEDTIETIKEIWFCEDESWQVDGEKHLHAFMQLNLISSLFQV